MNWTEGSLARHSRRRSSDSHHQKRRFAQARTFSPQKPSHPNAPPPPEAFSFLQKPTTSDLPSISSWCIQGKDKASHIDSDRRGALTNSAPNSAFWAPKENNRRKHHEISGGDSTEDIQDKKKKLLLNMDWLGLERKTTESQKASSLDGRGQDEPSKLDKHISPFFRATNTSQKFNIPVLPKFDYRLNVEPKVYIGNQSLRGTSEYQVSLYPPSVSRGIYRLKRPLSRSLSNLESVSSHNSPAYTHYASSSSPMPPSPKRHSRQLDPEPSTPVRELAHLSSTTNSTPKYMVESSSASFYQPRPQRTLRMLDSPRRSENQGSSVISFCGREYSSSGLESNPVVAEEWRVLLGLSVSPKLPSETTTQLFLENTNRPSASDTIASDRAEREQQRIDLTRDSSLLVLHPTATSPVLPSSPPSAIGVRDIPSLEFLQHDNRPTAPVDHALAPSFVQQLPDTGLNTKVALTTDENSAALLYSPTLTRKAITSDPPMIESNSYVGRVASPKFLHEVASAPAAGGRPVSRMHCSEDDWIKFVFGEDKEQQIREADVISEAIQKVSKNIVSSDSSSAVLNMKGYLCGSSDIDLLDTSPLSTKVQVDSDFERITKSTEDHRLISSTPTLDTTINTIEISSTADNYAQKSATSYSEHDPSRCDLSSDDSVDLVPLPIATSDPRSSTPTLTSDAQNFNDSNQRPARFALPKLFVRRLASGSGPAAGALQPSRDESKVHSLGSETGVKGKSKKRVKRWKIKDGRPNIRSLPDFASYPVEYSCKGEN